MKFTTLHIFLILLVKIMLSSKLHCQTVFKLKVFSYKIRRFGFGRTVALHSANPEPIVLSPQHSNHNPYTQTLNPHSHQPYTRFVTRTLGPLSSASLFLLHYPRALSLVMHTAMSLKYEPASEPLHILAE